MTLGCPESAGYSHSVGEDGRCAWCRQRLRSPAGPPRFTGHTELGDAYRRHYDPDWGGKSKDQDP